MIRDYLIRFRYRPDDHVPRWEESYVTERAYSAEDALAQFRARMASDTQIMSLGPYEPVAAAMTDA